MSFVRKVFCPAHVFLILCMVQQVMTAGAAPRRLVMTWVPPYAVAKCKARLQESYNGVGMKDALTHLGLQFWVPTPEGGLIRTGRTNETSDTAIAELRDWGRAHGVSVLLCVHNGVRSWDWSLARAAFSDHPDKFIDALLAEVNRLQLDGVDIDFEGNGTQDADKDAFVAFISRLARRLHAEGRHLTVDTFAYKWNAPNQSRWPDLLPHVDGLTTMGYAETGSKASGWQSYAFQKAAAGKHSGKLMIGLPSHESEWLGNELKEHLQWLKTSGEVGVAIWDAQLRSSAWRQPAVWRALGEIRGPQDLPP